MFDSHTSPLQQEATITPAFAGLTLAGGGTLVLGGANTYMGGTTINAGTVQVNAGGTIDNTSGTAVTLTSNNTPSWNADFTFTGTNNLNLGTRAVTRGATRQVTVAAGNLTVGGAIGDGGSGFGLTKVGAGALTLGGANTYTGTTTVTAGTLPLAPSLPYTAAGGP